jgi:2-hydroxycyclohexanecarboxyl-CoA dehydrogenase
MRGLEGKVALVTGGGGGIGTAICTRLAEEGCTVGVFDIDEAAANKTAQAVDQAGGGSHGVACDITDYDAVKASVAAFEAAAGPVDILVNNAGWDRFINFVDTEPGFWDQVIAINLKGPIHLHHAVLPGMAERRAGAVVNVASDAGRVGSSGEAVYSACKGGLIAFTKTVARELARSGVRANTVCPGPTETALFQSFLGEGPQGEKIHEALKRSIPLKRLGQPEDMPGAVAFLASDDAAYITGQTLSVSGGLTMAG